MAFTTNRSFFELSYDENFSTVNSTGQMLSRQSQGQMFLPCQLKMDARSTAAVVLFSSIFCLSIVGNSMVVVTIVRNGSMRTVTNLFLFNLAFSDLLLTLICMPPTLLGILFKCFLWGPLTCKMITYMQTAAVAACSFTLCIIALERYHAICRPLQSRHWKTKQHALAMIFISWALSFMCATPTLVRTGLAELRKGQFNCRETWSKGAETAYLTYLTAILLLVPLLLMSFLYSLVIRSLWKGIQVDKRGASQNGINGIKAYDDKEPKTIEAALANSNVLSTLGVSMSASKCEKLSENRIRTYIIKKRLAYKNAHCQNKRKFCSTSQNGGFFSSKKCSAATESTISSSEKMLPSSLIQNQSQSQSCTTGSNLAVEVILRSTHSIQSLASKKRIIKMMAVIVTEFFVCWTPLYVYHLSLMTFEWRTNPNLLLAFLTLAYISTCTNPLTYCFMNNKFRSAFIISFGCQCLRRRGKGGFLVGGGGGSTVLNGVGPGSRHTAASTPRRDLCQLESLRSGGFLSSFDSPRSVRRVYSASICNKSPASTATLSDLVAQQQANSCVDIAVIR